MAKIIFPFIILILGISQVNSRKCYNCNTFDHEGCDNPVNVNQIKISDCQPYSKCSKLVLNGENGESATLRGCVPLTAECKALPDVPGIAVKHCSFCDTDLCNSSVKISGGVFTILTLLVSLALSKMFVQ